MSFLIGCEGVLIALANEKNERIEVKQKGSRGTKYKPLEGDLGSCRNDVYVDCDGGWGKTTRAMTLLLLSRDTGSIRWHSPTATAFLTLVCNDYGILLGAMKTTETTSDELCT